MEITQIIGLSLTTVILLVLLRQEKPVFALLLSLSFGMVIFYLMLNQLTEVIVVMGEISRRAEIDTYFFGTLLKILGVAYLAEFASMLCVDAGEQMVAKKIEFAGKIIIAVMALPIVIAIIESLLQIIPR